MQTNSTITRDKDHESATLADCYSIILAWTPGFVEFDTTASTIEDVGKATGEVQDEHTPKD